MEVTVTDAGDGGHTVESAAAIESKPVSVEEDTNMMVQCNDCSRWVHAKCEGIDNAQYEAMTLGTHPVWGDEYLCPVCRIEISKKVVHSLQKEDKTHLFAEPVTEQVAKNYYDIIRNPMDLSTMENKAQR
jgi:nucleosome-remodeling factor subunit BPTF